MAGKTLGGAMEKLAPLISFDMIVDTDVGLINLIRNEYLDRTTFDERFFGQNPLAIVKELYNRKHKNPLYLFYRDGVDIDRLDAYYKQFVETRGKDILDLSITTEILNMLVLFVDTNEIMPTILCRTKDELDVLENGGIPSLANVNKIVQHDLRYEDLEFYTQFYFKTIEDAESFKHLSNKTFYFSSFGPNLNEDGDNFKESQILKDIITNGNRISVIGLYNMSILERK